MAGAVFDVGRPGAGTWAVPAAGVQPTL